jgi:hypothetical protein
MRPHVSWAAHFSRSRCRDAKIEASRPGCPAPERRNGCWAFEPTRSPSRQPLHLRAPGAAALSSRLATWRAAPRRHQHLRLRRILDESGQGDANECSCNPHHWGASPRMRLIWFRRPGSPRGHWKYPERRLRRLVFRGWWSCRKPRLGRGVRERRCRCARWKRCDEHARRE